MAKEINDGANEAELAASDCHHLLASDRRRLVIDVLAGHTEPVDLEELAVGIVAREAGVDAVDDATTERVAIDLHHVHLPKMRSFGVLDYDSESRRIVPADDLLDVVRTRLAGY